MLSGVGQASHTSSAGMGDAYFYRGELEADPRCTPGFPFYQTMMGVDRDLRFQNHDRLRRLQRQNRSEVTIFCSHDQKELEAMQRRNA